MNTETETTALNIDDIIRTVDQKAGYVNGGWYRWRVQKVTTTMVSLAPGDPARPYAVMQFAKGKSMDDWNMELSCVPVDASDKPMAAYFSVKKFLTYPFANKNVPGHTAPAGAFDRFRQFLVATAPHLFGPAAFGVPTNASKKTFVWLETEEVISSSEFYDRYNTAIKKEIRERVLDPDRTVGNMFYAKATATPAANGKSYTNIGFPQATAEEKKVLKPVIGIDT